jgi:hypothetical protein
MNSYKKGANAERELAAELTRILGVEAHRAASPWLPGILRPDVRLEAGNLHVEVKRRRRLSLPAALDQASHDAQGRIPVVFHRGNREGWVVSIKLEDLPRLGIEVASIINRSKAT